VEFYAGPVSAAIYVQNLETEIPLIIETWLSCAACRTFLDVHIVVDDNITVLLTGDRPFPVNILRNIPIRFSRTIHVFYIEADFIPNPTLHENLGPVIEKLKEDPSSIFIVPGFSTTDKRYCALDSDLSEFPKTKEELVRLLIKDPKNKSGIIALGDYRGGHRAFPYERWYHDDKIMPISAKGNFEPYYIGSRDYPLFDEIFIGCGQDKMIHYEELMRAQYKAYAFPSGFIVHLDSTGMGKPWCKNLYTRFPKKKAYELRLSEEYGKLKPDEFRKRFWWDQGPGIKVSGVSDKIAESDSTLMLKKTLMEYEKKIRTLNERNMELERELQALEQLHLPLIVQFLIICGLLAAFFILCLKRSVRINSH